MALKYGLKLWSVNKNYIEPARALHQDGVYQYIELYISPGSFANFIHFWKKLDIAYIIHAPHSYGGLNLSLKEMRTRNIEIAKEVATFANELGAPKIIYHPGISGDIEETKSQIGEIYDARLLIENKPYHTVKMDHTICVGHSVSQMEYLIKECSLGFCLDFGHAICAANALKIDKYQMIEEFMNLRPFMFHLSDGDANGLADAHKHIGRGSFDIAKILALVPGGSRVTIECEKDSGENLDCFRKDILTLRSLER